MLPSWQSGWRLTAARRSRRRCSPKCFSAGTRSSAPLVTPVPFTAPTRERKSRSPAQEIATMRQPHRVHRVGASAVSAAVPVRKTADTPTRARQSSVFPGACVRGRGKHSAWPSTAPRPSRTCVGTLSGGSPNPLDALGKRG